jgi:membrane associated rhomboid family serine protease/Tfp pilus assembly protein PilF
MANCVKCGRKLPFGVFGKSSNLCKWCVEYEAMQRGEVRDDNELQPVMTAPWKRSYSDGMLVTQIFAGICVAVFIGMALASEGSSILEPTNQQLLDWGANYGPYAVAGQWWRLLTSMFLHIGIVHIALNLWCLWNLGKLAESLYGRSTYAAIYLICGLAGSLASIAWHPATPSAGASGAIFGIAGAMIASLKLGEFSAPGTVVRGMLGSIVKFAAYNLILGVMLGFIDNAAHIGGLVAGLILGALIAKADPHQEKPVSRITVVTLVLLTVVGGAGWLHHAKGYVAHTQRAEELLDNEKADEAIAELQAAIKLHPNDAYSHYQLAHAYSMKDRVAEEETELKRALELQPDSKYAPYQLGVLYLGQKRTAESRQVFGRMLASDQQSADAHFGMGMVLADEGSDEAALKEFNTTAKIEPDRKGVYYQMATSSAKMKRYDDAIASYRKAIQVDGDYYDTEMGLAVAYEAKGMKQEAIEARNKAAALQSK